MRHVIKFVLQFILTLLVILLVLAFCQSLRADIPAENKNHTVTVTWIPPVKYDGFHIYRADKCSDFIYIQSVGKVKRYVDGKVLGGQTYWYKVRTVLSGAESKDSIVVTTTVPLT